MEACKHAYFVVFTKSQLPDLYHKCIPLDPLPLTNSYPHFSVVCVTSSERHFGVGTPYDHSTIIKRQLSLQK